MDSTALRNLYAEYTKEHKTQLSAKHFGKLVVFFPALLVIASDGVVDKEEWVYVKYLSKFMTDSYKKELTEAERADLNQNFYKQLEYLIDHLDEWEARFIDSLKAHLDEKPHQKEIVMETLHLFAEASEGESEDEAKKIEELVERLALEESL